MGVERERERERERQRVIFSRTLLANSFCTILAELPLDGQCEVFPTRGVDLDSVEAKVVDPTFNCVTSI